MEILRERQHSFLLNHMESLFSNSHILSSLALNGGSQRLFSIEHFLRKAEFHFLGRAPAGRVTFQIPYPGKATTTKGQHRQDSKKSRAFFGNNPWTLNFLVQSLRKRLSWQPAQHKYHPLILEQTNKKPMAMAVSPLWHSLEAVCPSQLDLWSLPRAGGPGSERLAGIPCALTEAQQLISSLENGT